jgi:hypothetical protein
MRVLTVLLISCNLMVAVNASVILQQDFEDTSVFVVGDAFERVGVGDGSTSVGLWRNPTTDGDWTPMAASDNSTFSSGSQCVELLRGSDSRYGDGQMHAVVDNAAADLFVAEFSLKVDDAAAGFTLHLINSDQTGRGPVGIRYSGGYLDTVDGGDFKPKTGGVTPGEWFRIKFEGSIAQGGYYAYIDWGRGAGYSLLDLDPQVFDNTTLTEVGGFTVYAYNSGQPAATAPEIYVDDAKIAVPEPATGMLLALGASAFIKRRR